MTELIPFKKMMSIRKNLDNFGLEMEPQEDPYTEDDYNYDVEDIKRAEAEGKWYINDCIHWNTQPHSSAPLKSRKYWAQGTLKDIGDARKRAQAYARENGTSKTREWRNY